jgi:hypothetical protein
VSGVFSTRAEFSPARRLAQDYGARLRWDPFLTDMKFRHGAAEAAVGVQAWVRARNRFSMTAEYITLDRPNAVAMKMIEGRSSCGSSRGRGCSRSATDMEARLHGLKRNAEETDILRTF